MATVCRLNGCACPGTGINAAAPAPGSRCGGAALKQPADLFMYRRILLITHTAAFHRQEERKSFIPQCLRNIKLLVVYFRPHHFNNLCVYGRFLTLDHQTLDFINMYFSVVYF